MEEREACEERSTKFKSHRQEKRKSPGLSVEKGWVNMPRLTRKLANKGMEKIRNMVEEQKNVLSRKNMQELWQSSNTVIRG